MSISKHIPIIYTLFIIANFCSCNSIDKDGLVGTYKKKNADYYFSIEIKKDGYYDAVIFEKGEKIVNTGKWRSDGKTILLSNWKFLDSNYVKPLCNCPVYDANLYKPVNGKLQIDFYIDDDFYSFVKD